MRFGSQMSEVPRLEQRLRCMIFRRSFPERMKEIKPVRALGSLSAPLDIAELTGDEGRRRSGWGVDRSRWKQSRRRAVW